MLFGGLFVKLLLPGFCCFGGLLFMFIFKGCLFSVCIWIDVWVGWYVVVVYFPILLGLTLVLGLLLITFGFYGCGDVVCV